MVYSRGHEAVSIVHEVESPKKQHLILLTMMQHWLGKISFQIDSKRFHQVAKEFF